VLVWKESSERFADLQVAQHRVAALTSTSNRKSGTVRGFDFDDNVLAATLSAERESRADESWKPLADLRVQIFRMVFGEQLVLVEVGGEQPRGSVGGAVTSRKARQATVFDGFDLCTYPHRQFIL